MLVYCLPSYIGFLLVMWVAFTFVISLYFSWVVRKTGSLLGVALSHGIINIMLFIVAQFYF